MAILRQRAHLELTPEPIQPEGCDKPVLLSDLSVLSLARHYLSNPLTCGIGLHLGKAILSRQRVIHDGSGSGFALAFSGSFD